MFKGRTSLFICTVGIGNTISKTQILISVPQGSSHSRERDQQGKKIS